MNQNKKIDKSAKALYSVFKENRIDQLGSEVLTTLSKIANTSNKFKQFLSTKRIDTNIKKDILSKILADSLSTQQLEVVYCLLDNIDFNHLDSINKKYQKLMLSSENHIIVKATTAYELNEAELSELVSNIESKTKSNISINNITDKTILGGIKLKVGNTLIDGSLSTKLEKLKQSMVNK